MMSSLRISYPKYELPLFDFYLNFYIIPIEIDINGSFKKSPQYYDIKTRVKNDIKTIIGLHIIHTDLDIGLDVRFYCYTPGGTLVGTMML